MESTLAQTPREHGAGSRQELALKFDKSCTIPPRVPLWNGNDVPYQNLTDRDPRFPRSNQGPISYQGD